MSKGFMLSCLVATGLLLAHPVRAKVIRCDVCTQDLDFRREAELAGQGTHLVYNLNDNILQQWYVGPPAGGDKPSRVTSAPRATPTGSGAGTRKRAPPPGASEELRRAHELYVKGGSSIKPIVVVPVDRLGLNPSARDKTAYEFVLDYNLRSMVESAAGSTDVISQVASANILTALADLTSVGTSYLGLKDQAALLLKVVFKDGSSVIIRVDLDHANGQYENDSARTTGGQAIPADVQQLRGEWTNYGGDDLNRMADQMRRLGATVTFAGQGRVVHAISCTPEGCIARTILY